MMAHSLQATMTVAHIQSILTQPQKPEMMEGGVVVQPSKEKIPDVTAIALEKMHLGIPIENSQGERGPETITTCKRQLKNMRINISPDIIVVGKVLFNTCELQYQYYKKGDPVFDFNNVYLGSCISQNKDCVLVLGKNTELD